MQIVIPRYLMPSWETGTISKHDKIIIYYFRTEKESYAKEMLKNLLLNNGIGMDLKSF